MATTRSLSRDDAIPLYHQIFLTLRDEILSGKRAEGSGIPTEHELGQQYGVSRITARRALDELAAQKLVERRRRTGTRVIFHAPAAPIEGNIDQAVESLIAFGRDTQVRVIAFGEEAASEEVATALRIDIGAPVLRALRLRSLFDQPLGAIESHVPAAIGKGLTRARLTTTPILELVRSAGHGIGGGRQTIGGSAADPVLSSLLEIEPRAALLRIERVVDGTDGCPLLHTVAHYRADRYRLSLDFNGGARPEI